MMLSHNHVSKRPVRQAMKLARTAVNQALDAAEPRIEKAAGSLEDFSRDTVKAIRKSSLARLDDLRSNYKRLGKRAKKQVPFVMSRQRAGKLALIAAGIAILAFGIFRSS
jgi:hypothetical protein